jgi:N-acyl-D-amino-acid deacylase
LIGVNIQGISAKQLKQVMDKENLNWRSFVDDGSVRQKWKPAGTPTFYVIDHQGVIRYKWAGAPGEKAIDAALEKTIHEAEEAAKKRAPVAAPAPRQAQRPQQAIQRGLTFLEKDAAEWRKDRKCATCHHGTMTVWALSEAKSQGYAVSEERLADALKWTKERFLKDIDKPRDTRMGWNMVNTSAVFMAMMAQAVPKQDAVSAGELKQIAGHLLRHQEAEGHWAWSIAPPKNRPPPVFESDEVVTLMAYVVLGRHATGDAKENAEVRSGREKAIAWLAKNKPGTGTQAAAVRLFRDVQARKPAKEIQAGIDGLLARQNKDGGWGQEKDLPSDAFATGQTLYSLSLAGVKNDRAEIQRAVSFLVTIQKADGSWPMTSRAHPGATPMTNPVPITYFGSAWATMGLMRSVAK